MCVSLFLERYGDEALCQSSGLQVYKTFLSYSINVIHWVLQSALDRKQKSGISHVLPFQANDALHLSLLDGCDVSIDQLGDVILQDTFHVWDPKKLIRQSRERRMFLFELYLVFSKEVKDSNGKAKYQYKMKMMVSLIAPEQWLF